MQTINQSIIDRTEAIRETANEAEGLMDYLYANLGLQKPSNNKEEYGRD